MSLLYVYHAEHPEQPYKVLTHAEDIVALLTPQDIQLTHEAFTQRLTPGMPLVALQQALADDLPRWQAAQQCDAVELFSLAGRPGEESVAQLPHDERVGAGRCAYGVLAGRALLTMQAGADVLALELERGDWLSLPAGCVHWLDAGEFPQLIAVQLQQTAAPLGYSDSQALLRFARLAD